MLEQISKGAADARYSSHSTFSEEEEESLGADPRTDDLYCARCVPPLHAFQRTMHPYNGDEASSRESIDNANIAECKPHNADTVRSSSCCIAAARCLSHDDNCVAFYRADASGTANSHLVPAVSTARPVGPNSDNWVTIATGIYRLYVNQKLVAYCKADLFRHENLSGWKIRFGIASVYLTENPQDCFDAEPRFKQSYAPESGEIFSILNPVK